MKVKKIPMRQCAVCHTARTKKELVRVVKTPDMEVGLDDTGKMRGRGAYICPDIECFKKARKTKALEKSLSISIPDDIYDVLERQIAELER